MLSIILRSWDALNFTKLTIESLIRNTYGDYELIVVDNHSQNNTVKYLKNLAKSSKNIKLILNNENLGVSKATDQGIKNSKGSIIAIIDNDVLVPKNWNTLLLEEMNNNNAEIIAPQRFSSLLHFKDNQPIYKVWNDLKIKKYDLHNKNPYELFEEFSQGLDITEFSNKITKHNKIKTEYVISPPGFVSGSLILFNKKILKIIDGFVNKEFSLYGGEDVDFCWRAGMAEIKIVRSGMVYVHHFEHSSIRENSLNHEKELISNNKVLLRYWKKVLLSRINDLIDEGSSEEDLKNRYLFVKLLLENKDYL